MGFVVPCVGVEDSHSAPATVQAKHRYSLDKGASLTTAKQAHWNEPALGVRIHPARDHRPEASTISPYY